MKYGLPDEVVKRIAATAYHDADKKIKAALQGVSTVYNTISEPNTIGKITQAHMTDAMQHKFRNKDEENSFKTYFAKSAAINRGTLNPIPTPKG